MNDLSNMTSEQRQQHAEFVVLLSPVKDWLSSGAKHERREGFGFNMDYQHRDDCPDYNQKQCGTAMCIGGAITQFNPEQGFGLGDLGGIRTRFFEIDDQIAHLFYPDSGVPWEKITPTMALQAIENFENCGEPCWNEIPYDGNPL